MRMVLSSGSSLARVPVPLRVDSTHAGHQLFGQQLGFARVDLNDDLAFADVIAFADVHLGHPARDAATHGDKAAGDAGVIFVDMGETAANFLKSPVATDTQHEN